MDKNNYIETDKTKWYNISKLDCKKSKYNIVVNMQECVCHKLIGFYDIIFGKEA